MSEVEHVRYTRPAPNNAAPLGLSGRWGKGVDQATRTKEIWESRIGESKTWWRHTNRLSAMPAVRTNGLGRGLPTLASECLVAVGKTTIGGCIQTDSATEKRSLGLHMSTARDLTAFMSGIAAVARETCLSSRQQHASTPTIWSPRRIHRASLAAIARTRQRQRQRGRRRKKRPRRLVKSFQRAGLECGRRLAHLNIHRAAGGEQSVSQSRPQALKPPAWRGASRGQPRIKSDGWREISTNPITGEARGAGSKMDADLPSPREKCPLLSPGV